MKTLIITLLFMSSVAAQANAWHGWRYADDANAPINDDEPTFTRYDHWLEWGVENLLAPKVEFNRSSTRGSRYNDTGWQIQELGLTQTFSRAVLYDPPDKYVVAGYYDNGSVGGFIARFWLDGMLDSSFSGDGVETLAFGGEDAVFHAITTDASGRYLVAGKRAITGSLDYDFLVARYGTDGNLDNTFNTTGHTVVSINSSAIARAVGVDSVGRIVVGGYVEAGYYRNIDMALARLDTDGSPDASFGTAGIVTTMIDPYGHDMIFALRVVAGDKIAVTGASRNSNDTGDNANIMVARYNTDGSLDNTFDTDGINTHDITNHDSNWAMTVDASGRLVTCGRTLNGAVFQNQFTVFGTAGNMAVSFQRAIQNRSICRAIEIDEGGNYAVGGRVWTGAATGDWGYEAMRVLTSGAFDTTFSANGWDLQELGGTQDDYALGLTYNNNKWIMVGNVDTDATATIANQLGAIRYGSDGVAAGGGDFDTWFNVTGYNVVNPNADQAQGYVMRTDNSGRYIVGGFAENGNAASRDILISRFLTTGALDTSFAVAGIYTLDLAGDQDEANGLVVDSAQRIYAGGWRETGGGATRDFYVIRLSSTGVLDTTWGTGGIVTADQSGRRDELYKLAIASNGTGNIYAGGWAQTGGNANTRDYAVVRFNSAGVLDTSYGASGWALADFGLRDEATAMALSTDNKVYIGGWAESGAGGATTRRIGIARFNTTGALDTGWGGTGLVTLEIDTGNEDRVDALYFNTDGTVLAAGTLDRPAADDAVIFARYLNNGNLDTSFGVTAAGYTIVLETNGFNELVHEIGHTNNGKLIVNGRSQGPGMILRFFSDGSLDTFGNTTLGYGRPNGPGGDFLYHLITLSDGKYMIGGRTNNGLAIMRVWP
ncbi:MAG: hypothetical protein H6617_09270 [Bdellovibrionaceae bacterium]|nr:hypothetical protein [Pseudobdellovibrionaceae bacterium]